MNSLQSVINFLIKKTSGEAIKIRIMSNKELQKNYKNQLVENSRKGKFTHLL